MTAKADRNRWLIDTESGNHTCTNKDFLIFDFRPRESKSQPRRLDGSIHDQEEQSEGVDMILERRSR